MASPLAQRFLRAVRETVGTPWHDQGRLVGVGLDCWGVVVYGLSKAGLYAPDASTAYRRADRWSLLRPALEERCERVGPGGSWAGVASGDLAIWTFGRLPHVAVVAALDDASESHLLVHTLIASGAVVEAPSPSDWGPPQEIWRLKPHSADASECPAS